MSEDWAVRTSRPIALEQLHAALLPAIGGLRARMDATGQWVVVVDVDDRPRLWVSGPHGTADGRGSQLELCAAGHDGVPGYGSPVELVRRAATGIADRVGGTAERLSTASEPEDIDADGTLRRVLPDDCPGDALTDAVTVVVQSRPTVALTPWLMHQQQWCARSGRRLVVVTGTDSCLTPALSSMLRSTGGQWVVDTGNGLYDGHLGLTVTWDERDFTAGEDLRPEFTPRPEDTWAPLAHAETVHPYSDGLRIGNLTTGLYAAAGLSAPRAVGVVEPAETPYDPALLTEIAQHASPGPSRFVLAGMGTDGWLDVLPQPPGVVEQVEVTLDPRAEAFASAALAAFADQVLEAGAEIAVLGYRRSTGGRQVPSRQTGPTVPAVAVFARRRFPTLNDAGALRLAGRPGRLVETPVPALVVEYAATPGRPGSEDAGESLLRLIDGLSLHDTYLQNAQE
ncbi:DUF6177 family protein [Luteipulveratus flavus]|uniref:DUF6177 family protein n=1 Tax=Luteipulveratus flavus TaxID=3031728 RepID=A0ABT6CAD6_9MICO|nr:DUF6177 family protein [Luteipulveratus sp. YIM 133296]MDF8265483.1 DUF6177 family protein [Luteipulveratus sp. YIM 133296]